MKSLKHAALAAILCILFPLSACSAAPTPTPTPTDDFVPVPVVAVAKAKIAAWTYESNTAYDPIMKRLNEALAASGQNVEFMVQHVAYDQNNSSAFMDKVKTELTAGNASADAYMMSFTDSAKLFDDALTMDLTDMIPQNAPVYYFKYKDLFPAKLTGVPVGLYNKPLWLKAALMLRSDFESAGSGITTTDNLFAFLDETIVKPKKQYTVLASPENLISQWALERGYYTLSFFGVNGYLFAGVNDASCTPVTLESIPGFGGFMLAMKQYYLNGSLNNINMQAGNKQAIGIVKNLGEYYVSNQYIWLTQMDGQYAAHVFSPELPCYFVDPVYMDELAIPSVCAKEKAAEVIQFVDWFYTEQQNYDKVIYGEEGVDYTADKGRYSPLINGNQQKLTDYNVFKTGFFTWPGVDYLINFDFARLPACAPANIEQLVDDGLKGNLKFPAAAYIKTDRKSLDKMMKVTDEINAAVQERNEKMNALVNADPVTFTKDSMQYLLDEAKKCRNQFLIDQYGKLIKGFMGQ